MKILGLLSFRRMTNIYATLVKRCYPQNLKCHNTSKQTIRMWSIFASNVITKEHNLVSFNSMLDPNISNIHVKYVSMKESQEALSLPILTKIILQSTSVKRNKSSSLFIFFFDLCFILSLKINKNWHKVVSHKALSHSCKL